jgi:hypothetical protein
MRCLGQRMPVHPVDTLEGRNVRNLYWDTAWFGVLNGISLTFVSVFALRLGRRHSRSAGSPPYRPW